VRDQNHLAFGDLRRHRAPQPPGSGFHGTSPATRFDWAEVYEQVVLRPRKFWDYVNGSPRAEPEDWAELLEVLRRVGTVDTNEGTHRFEAVVPPGSPADRERVRIDLRVVEMSPPRLTPEALGSDRDDPQDDK
jgi:hypothetical protein